MHEEVTGERPRGWYAGSASEHATPLVIEAGGFGHSADSYADDLPYWIGGRGDPFPRSTPTTIRSTSSVPRARPGGGG